MSTAFNSSRVENERQNIARLFKWSKTTIHGERNSKSVDGKRGTEVRNEKEARKETQRRNRARAAVAAAEKFAFHPFQRWHSPFIRSVNQFESARKRNHGSLAVPTLAKA